MRRQPQGRRRAAIAPKAQGARGIKQTAVALLIAFPVHYHDAPQQDVEGGRRGQNGPLGCPRRKGQRSFYPSLDDCFGA